LASSIRTPITTIEAKATSTPSQLQYDSSDAASKWTGAIRGSTKLARRVKTVNVERATKTVRHLRMALLLAMFSVAKRLRCDAGATTCIVEASWLNSFILFAELRPAPPCSHLFRLRGALTCYTKPAMACVDSLHSHGQLDVIWST